MKMSNKLYRCQDTFQRPVGAEMWTFSDSIVVVVSKKIKNIHVLFWFDINLWKGHSVKYN